MNLTASLIVRNEMARFLEPCIRSLQSFVDEIRVVDDASDDGSFEWLAEQELVEAVQLAKPHFFVHEGNARQTLLEHTLRGEPDWVLSIDADELVEDGAKLRRLVEDCDRLEGGSGPLVSAISLDMEEVWRAEPDRLLVREDGGWRTHPVGCLWRAPALGAGWRMLPRKLACRRVPAPVLKLQPRASGVAVLHLGWTDPATRRERHARYVKHDKGRYHASRHLASILWDDARVTLRERPWPEGEAFEAVRARLAPVVA